MGAACLALAPVSADASTTTLAVLPFTGKPKSGLAPAETSTAKALSARHDLQVLGHKQVASALKSAKISTTSSEGLQHAAKLLKARLLVLGQLHSHRLSLELCDGSTGAVLANAAFDGHGEGHAQKFPGLDPQLLHRWSASIDAVVHPVPVAPPPPIEPVPAPAAPVAPPPAAVAAPVLAAAAPVATVESPAPSAPPARAALGPIFIDLALGAGVLARSLRYNQDLFGVLAGYQLYGTPVFGGALALYPLAAVSNGFVANLGLAAEWQRTAGFDATLSGQQVSASSDRLAAGLRLRLPIGPSELRVTGEYGRQYFRFGALPGQASPIPNYDYDFLLAALDARIVFGDFALLLGGGYIGVLQNGIADSGYFPHSQVAGIDGQLGGAFALTEVVELRLVGDYQRFFFSMESRPNDVHVAGGATDEYLSIILALALRFRS
jgi:hypothetical protein